MPEQRLYATHHGGSGFRRRLRGVPPAAWAAGVFLALTLAVFGRVLFGPGGVVLSDIDTDLAKQFVHWRAFGFGELRAGHLALWNPHIYCGAPYFGGFQAALLYPPNWLYLCLPLARAINVGIALHVFLAGLFMYFWTRQRALHPLACVLAGVLFMFSGPYYLHVYAGHLPNLCTMVWGPLVFLAIDGWLEQRTAGWLLMGAGAVAMQILAGHPQYVFYTGVAAALYTGSHLFGASRRLQAVAGLAALVIGAVGLSAVQLFEGFHAAGESIRSVGTSMEFAAVFSFPPENVLTFLVPGFFGDLTHYDYWGRCYLWEMSLFFGVSGLVLAIYGALRGDRSKQRFCTGMAAVLLLFALGSHTPLFKWLYLCAPGFNRFRGWSKFTFPAVLFLITLAAVGYDRLLRSKRSSRRLAYATLTASAVLLLGGGWAFTTIRGNTAVPPALWTRFVRHIKWTQEPSIPTEQAQEAAFLRAAAHFAASQTLLAGGTLLLLGGVLLVARRYPRAAVAVLVVAVGEMGTFAWSSYSTFPLTDAVDTPVAEFLRAQPSGDYRIFNAADPNLAMSIGARGVWGYDPGVLRRYAEWMNATQGIDASQASEMLTVHDLPPACTMLTRCRYVLFPPKNDADDSEPLQILRPLVQDQMSHLQLITRISLRHDRDDILDAMQDPSFNPAHTIILETPPDPAPDPAGDGPAGTAKIVAETSDALTIEAALSRAAVLLVTDAYCTGWEVTSLLPAGQGGQSSYRVVPGDYCFRAIPLAAGFHRFVLAYRPRAFVIGKWVTLASLGLYLALGVAYLSGRFKFRPSRLLPWSLRAPDG